MGLYHRVNLVTDAVNGSVKELCRPPTSRRPLQSQPENVKRTSAFALEHCISKSHSGKAKTKTYLEKKYLWIIILLNCFSWRWSPMGVSIRKSKMRWIGTKLYERENGNLHRSSERSVWRQRIVRESEEPDRWCVAGIPVRSIQGKWTMSHNLYGFTVQPLLFQLQAHRNTLPIGIWWKHLCYIFVGCFPRSVVNGNKLHFWGVGSETPRAKAEGPVYSHKVRKGLWIPKGMFGSWSLT